VHRPSLTASLGWAVLLYAVGVGGMAAVSFALRAVLR